MTKLVTKAILIFFAIASINICVQAEWNQEFEPWALLDGKYYYIGNYQEVTWHRANQICAIQGMTMAALESKAESDALATYLSDNEVLGAKYWLSGTDLSGEQLYWQTTGLTIKNYSNWARGEPRNSKSSGKHCVYTNAYFKWQVDDCNAKHYFLCYQAEKPACGIATNECTPL